jgi:hypothetical protein
VHALRCFVVGIAIASGALAPLRVARAESPSTELAWSAPSVCPEEAVVRADVERYLGQALGARRDQKLRIEGVVKEDPRAGFTVTLRVTSARGTQRRELANADCTKLSEAAALVVALAIDPKLVVPTAANPGLEKPSDGEEPPRPPSEPAEPLERPPTEAPVATPPATEPPVTTGPPALRVDREHTRSGASGSRPSSSWSFSAAFTGLAGGGPLPGVALGLGARLSAGREWFRLALHGSYFFPRSEPVSMAPSSAVELDLFRAGVSVCGAPITGSIVLSACVGPTLGDLRGSGARLDNERTRHDRWSAVLGELTLAHLSSSGLMTLAGLEAGYAIEAPRFGILQNGRETEVFRASDWVAGAFLGIGLSR